MTSELRVDNLKGSTTGGSINVLGEGTSATTNLQQGLAKVWVTFDGTASGATIRDSFNVSSITDNGQGDYTVTMTTAMSNTNYVVQATSGDGATSAVRGCGVCNSLTTTTFRVQPNFTGGTLNGLYTRDDPIVCCSVFGD